MSDDAEGWKILQLAGRMSFWSLATAGTLPSPMVGLHPAKSLLACGQTQPPTAMPVLLMGELAPNRAAPMP